MSVVALWFYTLLSWQVMCLAAATESGSPLLAPVLSSGALQSLMQSGDAGVRAAAASTMTKLSIKAKALLNDSSELTQILNTVLAVLKNAVNPGSGDATDGGKLAQAGTKVSFSKHDITAASTSSASSSSSSSSSTKAKGGKGGKATAPGGGGGRHGSGGTEKKGASSALSSFQDSLGSSAEGGAFVSAERAIEVSSSYL